MSPLLPYKLSTLNSAHRSEPVNRQKLSNLNYLKKLQDNNSQMDFQPIKRAPKVRSFCTSSWQYYQHKLPCLHDKCSILIIDQSHSCACKYSSHTQSQKLSKGQWISLKNWSVPISSCFFWPLHVFLFWALTSEYTVPDVDVSRDDRFLHIFFFTSFLVIFIFPVWCWFWNWRLLPMIVSEGPWCNRGD